MVAERVAAQLADDAMILVQVVAVVGEHDIRSDVRRQRLHVVLHLAPEVREVALAERRDAHVDLGAVFEKGVGRDRGFFDSLVVAAQDHPVAGDGTRLHELEQRRAATDLDVVGMRADAEHVDR